MAATHIYFMKLRKMNYASVDNCQRIGTATQKFGGVIIASEIGTVVLDMCTVVRMMISVGKWW